MNFYKLCIYNDIVNIEKVSHKCNMEKIYMPTKMLKMITKDEMAN